MAEMKYYIVYANWKPELQGMDDIQGAMEKYSKVVEEAGCKVKLWGSALGVPESAVCVIKGSPENYLKLFPPQAPWTNSRTNVVVTF